LVAGAAAALVLSGGLVSGGWGCSSCGLSVSTRALPDATVGQKYSFSLSSNCGGGAWFLQTGSLPPGIGLQDDGDLIGIPTLAGIYTFTVGVFDFASGETAFKGLSLTVDDAPTPTPTTTPTLGGPTGSATPTGTATQSPSPT
jgi:hypothetical protein